MDVRVARGPLGSTAAASTRHICHLKIDKKKESHPLLLCTISSFVNRRPRQSPSSWSADKGAPRAAQKSVEVCGVL